MPNAASCGFTLLEVILAIALMVGFMGAIMTFYHQASSVRRVIADDMNDSMSQRVMMDRWSEDLEGALPYSFLQMGVEGTINEETNLPELRFVTATLPGPAIWAVRKSTEDPIPPECDLQMVTYRLSSFKCDRGHVHISGLERVCEKVIAPREIKEGKEGKEGKDVSPSMSLPQVKFLDLQYYDGAQWYGQWPMKDWDDRDPRRSNLPMAIKVVVGGQELPPGTEVKDYPYPTYSRTIFLTGGSMSLDKTVIRRPGRVNR